MKQPHSFIKQFLASLCDLPLPFFPPPHGARATKFKTRSKGRRTEILTALDFVAFAKRLRGESRRKRLLVDTSPARSRPCLARDFSVLALQYTLRSEPQSFCVAVNAGVLTRGPELLGALKNPGDDRLSSALSYYPLQKAFSSRFLFKFILLSVVGESSMLFLFSQQWLRIAVVLAQTDFSAI